MTARQTTLAGETAPETLFRDVRRRLCAAADSTGGFDETTVDQRREIAREAADGLQCVEYAGAGNNRAAFAVSDRVAGHEESVVLKVAFKASDRECNRNERACWSRFEETEVADLFAPVVAGDDDGRWILQRAVSAGTCKGVAKGLRDRLRDHDLPVMDVNAENTGWLGDDAVVFDYPWREAWLDC